MSHPNPLHDRENEYPSDDYRSIRKEYKNSRKKVLNKKKHYSHISKMISSLEERKGEAPLQKLKRLIGQ